MNRLGLLLRWTLLLAILAWAGAEMTHLVAVACGWPWPSGSWRIADAPEPGGVEWIERSA